MMRIPSATYRLQFTPSFGFKEARKIVEYLSQLGISDIYASPIFKAIKGSKHGYNIIDPNRLNPQLGSQSDFDDLMQTVTKHNMGWLQDIVPNHMAYDSQNPMLFDVLEKGQKSCYGDFFDIRWDYTFDELDGRIMAPFLGKPLPKAMQQNEITLQYDHGQIWVCYYDKKFPLRLKCYPQVLMGDLQSFIHQSDIDPDTCTTLTGLFDTLTECEILNDMPLESATKQNIRDIYQANPAVKQWFDDHLATLNDPNKTTENQADLSTLLADQFYRLTHWQATQEIINYRRFFYLNDFIALTIQNTHVLNDTHRLIFQLVRDKHFTGLRIDHIDGLYNPLQYLRRVKEKTADIYIVVEKILAFDEPLAADWPIQGTTGYDFLNIVNGLFCQGDNKAAFSNIHRQITAVEKSPEDLLVENKKRILHDYLAGDLNYVVYCLRKVLENTQSALMPSKAGLKTVLAEILACLPIYRTYLTGLSQQSNIAYLQDAIDKAHDTLAQFQHELYIIARVLLDKNKKASRQRLDFVAALEQLCSALMAKGFEDTYLYNDFRFTSLNEVGGDPSAFGTPLERFHQFNQTRSKSLPHAMNTTATHDTKHGEDVRARLNVLSEIPDRWQRHVQKWMHLNRSEKTSINGNTPPDANDEYLLYQTLIGTAPFDQNLTDEYRKRIRNYMIKAVREAKRRSTWIEPNNPYENGCTRFIARILNPSGENEFLKDFLPFYKTIAYYGIFNSLSQTLIKLTAPGIPDFYQGGELWDFNLVDPDNRRPVDYAIRQHMLDEIRDASQTDLPGLISLLLQNHTDARIKLFLTDRTLAVRKQYCRLFQDGNYCPLAVRGPFAKHIIAFARTYQDQCAVTIVPRFLTGLISENELPLGENIWKDTTVIFNPPFNCSLMNSFTAKTLEISDNINVACTLAHFPVCLLCGSN